MCSLPCGDGTWNPDSKQSLTEHTVHGEVTPDWNLLSQILDQDKQGGTLGRETVPASVAHLVYILEDSIVGPQSHLEHQPHPADGVKEQCVPCER
ncbi:PRELI domain-containing protein 1, mitochondrial [Lemmus lemmus]